MLGVISEESRSEAYFLLLESKCLLGRDLSRGVVKEQSFLSEQE